MPKPVHPAQVPLWRQLQGAAALLMAVRGGQSITAALADVDAALRPGVQSLGFHALRWLGRAEALRQQLARRAPPPEVDALLCVALGCMAPTLVAARTARGLAGRGSRDASPLSPVQSCSSRIGAAGSSPSGAELRLGRPGAAFLAPTLVAARTARGAPENSDLVTTEWPLYTAYTLVDQTVEAAKRGEATRHQASFINGCLRRFLREQDALLVLTDKSPPAVWNHPQWWIDQVRKDHPAHWQAVLQANNSRAPLILRINERKTTQTKYLRALNAINIEAFPVGKSGVILAVAQPVTALPGFAEGHFSVQDAAAQLAAPLLLQGLPATAEAGARPRILDACAAPGGKTAHLLELADCAVTALDIDARRCERVAQNLKRLGLHADIVVGDAGRAESWWDGRPYDAILLDAPCTASGIVRRHPDVRWLRRPGDIAQLAAIQAHLLKTLWPLVKAGGRLLYCTCSVFRAEGDMQIQTFLARHTNARLMPSPGHLLPQSGVATTGFPDNLLREHDGFYFALLEKRSD